MTPEQLDHLIDDYLDGSLTPEQRDTFERDLLADPAKLDMLIAAASVHRLLQDRYAAESQDGLHDLIDTAGVETSEPEGPSVMDLVVDQALAMRRQHEIEDEANKQLAAQQAEDARNRRFELRRLAEPEPVKRVVVIPRIAVVGAVAAVLLIAVGLIYRPARPAPPRSVVEQSAEEQTVIEIPTVALLLDAYQPRWGQAAPKTGERMLPGKYELMSGAVQIAFDRGATVLIEGPAQFELVDDNTGRLSLGNLSAQIPESAHGFTIDLPRGKLTDLGTAFGVHIDESGETETVVFTGIIEARAIARNGMYSPPLRLNQGDGARLAQRAATFEAQPIDPRQFARDLRGVSHDVRVIGEAKLLDAPPVTVEVDQLEDYTTAVVFLEREGVHLTRQLACGITEPGDYNTAALQHASAVLAPQAVDSYLLHSDTELGKFRGPPDTPEYTLEFTIIFPRPVVAVLTHTDQMVASDTLLGAPRTRYDDYAGRSLVERGIPVPSASEFVSLSEDRRTLRVRMHASNADQLRVLIEADDLDSSFGAWLGDTPGQAPFLLDGSEIPVIARCCHASS